MKSIYSIFSALVLSTSAFGQMEAVLYSENYNQIVSTYQQIKGNLPDYFFSYGLGGLNEANEGYVKENTMQARSYVVPMPVLITGEKNFSPYELWLAQFVKKDELNKPDNSTTAENIQPLTLKEKLSIDPSFANLDSASQAKILKREEIRLEEAKKQEMKLQKKETKVVTNSGKTAIEQNKNLSTSAAAVSEETPLKLLPDTMQAKLKEMGDKAGYKWLYQQQIIAGNVLFCDPASLIPSAINFRTTEEIVLYKSLLKTWKKAYPNVWQNSALEQHQLLANDFDAYFAAFGKASSMNTDFRNHFEMYNIELQRITAQ